LGTSSTQARDRQRWLASLLLAVAFHLVLLAVLAWLRPFDPGEVRASVHEPIELVFEPLPQPPDASSSEDDEPDFFSELPPDRADLPPDQADFLSNVDSRARDRREGGEDGGLPELDGESEAPHVAMLPEPASPTQDEPGQGEALQEQPEEAGPPSLDPSPEPEPSESPPEPQESEPQTQLDPSRSGERAPEEPAAESSEPPPLSAPRTGDPRQDILRDGRSQNDALVLLRRSGQSDLFQEEMSYKVGNVAQFGDVSLNTVAWDYAPWLMRFRRDFVRNWVPPYAYFLGLIHGFNVVELEIATDGTLMRMDLLEQEGHESLAQNSMAALRSIAPYQRLPADFPEETLILRIKLIYPNHDG
jgi:hypothetical protein